MSAAEKLCCACHEQKALSEYHRRSQSPDGLAYRCKTCARAHTNHWRHETGRNKPVNSRVQPDGTIRCFTCRRNLPRDMFHRDLKRARHGAASQCKDCYGEYRRVYNKANAERDRERARAYFQANKEEILRARMMAKLFGWARREDQREREAQLELEARYPEPRFYGRIGPDGPMRRVEGDPDPEGDERALNAEITDLYLFSGRRVAYFAHLAEARLEDDAEIVADERERRPAMSTAEHRRTSRRAA